MRDKIVAANWKMNKSLPQAIELMQAITFGLKQNPVACKVVIAPPFLYLERVVNETKGLAHAAAQNCCSRNNGAYTGEVSADMIQSVGASYCIVGHSERRKLYAETPDVLEAKLQRCYDHSLTPIFCIGENHAERTENRHFDVVAQQLEYVLFNFGAEEVAKTVIAYEPVWAIGTGLTASPEQAQEMHAFIRKHIADKFGLELADDISILYGGSCNAQNAAGLFAQQDIDGGLIGGAALVADDFLKICNELR
ncbi:MAG: triose-phosphate isomerase [Sphingobacteriales bacterium JAD_PAG50586_3]|nr:MAG: triose-phosphate isomerase [Sphingobacteriales bacterium JAD_PAG50586_3]